MLNVALPKIDGVSDQPAIEMNSVFNEMQNTILSTGQALSGGDLFQSAKSIATYSASSDHYLDTGAANAYTLTSIGLLKAPPAYVNGMRIRFVPTNTNTGASTVNTATLGVKNILDVRGNPLQGGELIVSYRVECIYDGTNFVLIDQGFGSIANVAVIDSPGPQVIPTGVSTKAIFNIVSIDTFNIYNVGSTRIQAAIPGLYRINVSTELTSVPAAGQFNALLYKNGLFENELVILPLTIANNIIIITSSVFINSAVGDYFEIYVAQDTGSNATFEGILEVQYIGQV